MAFSKTTLFIGLVFAVMLVVSSQVSARELAEATQESLDSVEEAKHHGHGHGHCHGHGHGHKHEHEHCHGHEHGHGHGKGHEHGHCKPGHGGHPPHGDEETESNEN